MLPPSTAELFGDNTSAIKRYVDILANRGIDWGLIGPREADRLWERHIFNCAALALLVTPQATVLDVGSGAGLPGIPLALARPDLSIVLLEPMLRRAKFLDEVVAELELGPRVQVVRGRAEEQTGSYAVVTARAVAPLHKLLSWTTSFFVPNGELLALKGSSAQSEIDAAHRVLTRHNLMAEIVEAAPAPDIEPATVVRVRPVSRETQ